MQSPHLLHHRTFPWFFKNLPTPSILFFYASLSSKSFSKESKEDSKLSNPSHSSTPLLPISHIFHISIPKYKKGQSRFDVLNYDSSERTPLSKYKRYSLSDLMSLKEWPSQSISTTKDFIHNALYNPYYGYFCRPDPPIFHFTDPAKFSKYQSHLDFLKVVEHQYEFLDAAAHPSENPNVHQSRQIWHTPTEIFKPWYGYGIAKYILEKYQRNEQLKAHPLEIFEIGGGNGTMMINILDYLQKEAPVVYEKVHYTIIELSPTLSREQKKRCPEHHHSKLTFHCGSIFDWEKPIAQPCFVIALEVIDNFSHDLIRWNMYGQPHQGVVVCNEFYDFSEMYEPVTDPFVLYSIQLQQAYFNFRTQSSKLLRFPNFFLNKKNEPPTSNLPLWHPLRHTNRFPWLATLPFLPNFTPKVFLPTQLISFFQLLHTLFKHHHLILSDFSSLPNTIQGTQAPVVQTRFKGTMVPVKTYMVLPGYFDIFFPTDFQFAKFTYDVLANEKHHFFSERDQEKNPLFSQSFIPTSSQLSNVFSHKHFMMNYANLEATRTKSGENPLLLYYQNAHFLVT